MCKTTVLFNGNKACNKCGRELRRGEDIYLFDEDGEFYCEECADEMKKAGAESQSFRKYCMESKRAVIVFEDDIVSMLDDGLYRISRQSLTVEKFGDDRKELWQQVSDELYTDEYDVLEIRNHEAVYYFAVSRWSNKYNPYLYAGEYEDAYTDICPGGNYEDCYFIVSLERAIGLTTKETAEHIADFAAFKNGGLSLISYKEMKKMAEKSAFQRRLYSVLQKLTPSVMLEECRKRVQGQPMLKTAVFIIYNYLMALERGDLKSAESWLLTAPSGMGKTEFYRAIRDIFKKYDIPVPVVNVDLSLITEAGFRGNNVDSIHDAIMEADSDTDGYGICFLDEADKKCLPSHSSKGDNVNAAVQTNLLTMVEGTVISTRRRTFDTAKTMFVFLGSFQDVRDNRQDSRSGKSLGFSSEKEPDTNYTDAAGSGFYDDISLQEMIDFGMKEELAGRIGRVINFGKISEGDMKQLIKSKAYEIGDSMGIDIEISDRAVCSFLGIAYGTLGVRRPMNVIRELVQDALTEVFFDDSFDIGNITVEIKSADKAKVKKQSKRRFTA